MALHRGKYREHERQNSLLFYVRFLKNFWLTGEVGNAWPNWKSRQVVSGTGKMGMMCPQSAVIIAVYVLFLLAKLCIVAIQYIKSRLALCHNFKSVLQ